MIVLGFASAYLKTGKAANGTATDSLLIKPQLRWLATSAAAMLAIFSFSKAASQTVHHMGERANDLNVAVSYFDVASRIDPDNAGAELSSAESLAGKDRWAESIPHFRRAIDRGFGVSIVYSYMANAHEKSGDLASAEQSLREAAAIFPRSTFIRARLAIVLEQLGRHPDADAELAFSRSVDQRQTNGWYSVIKDGILKAHLNSVSEPDKYDKPPELFPAGAIHAYNNDKVRFDLK